MYNVIKGMAVNYDDQKPFVIEAVMEDESEDLTDEQEAIVRREIARREKEIEANAEKRVKEMINRAQNDAEQMLEDARREAAVIYNSQRKAGYEQGALEASEKYSVILENSNALIERENERFENEIKRLSDDVLDLSLEMAKKIMNIEFERNDLAILGALNKLIDEYKNEKKLIIDVSVENLNRLKDTELAEKYELRANKALSDRDAQIELDSGIIDLSADKQLENLENVLKEI